MKEITPVNNNGSIVLRFTYGDVRHSFNPVPKGRYGDHLAMSKAHEIARKVYQDCITGYFDPTYAKYNPESTKGRTASDAKRDAAEARLVIAERDAINNVNIETLFHDFTVFKTKTLKSNSLIDYRAIQRKLAKCPHKQAREAVDIVRWFVDDHKGSSTSSVEKHLKLLNACCNWGVASEKLQNNPFDGLRKLIPTTKNSAGDDDINPFTSSERDAVIEAFKNSEHYSYYAPLVEFVFITGCRPEEGLALQWKHVKGASVTFCQKVTASGEIEAGTKTEKKRSITVNARVEHVLSSIKSPDALPDDFVFPSKKGGLIDWHNFANRAWKKVLASLDSIEYRNPYQMRHTAITVMVRGGTDSVMVAKWVGNSPNMIAKRYLGSVGDIAIPE